METPEMETTYFVHYPMPMGSGVVTARLISESALEPGKTVKISYKSLTGTAGVRDVTVDHVDTQRLYERYLHIHLHIKESLPA